MKTFKRAVFDGLSINIDGKVYTTVPGKHAIWIPEMEAKIIWTHNGRIESYRDWDKGQNQELIQSGTFNDQCRGYTFEAVTSILNEVNLLRVLAKFRMAPPVGCIFHIENFTSFYPFGVWHNDVKGRYGYYIKDAKGLQPGDFSFDKFAKAFLETGLVRASQGAQGDLLKENNIVNGYLIDIRRTIWDMIVLTTPYDADEIRFFVSNPNVLKDKILELGQFPFKQRSKNYQSYFLDGFGYQEGSRDTLYRLDRMKVPGKLSGESVVDLGCCYGSVCVEMYNRGARNITGLDFQPEYIDCARALARYNGMQINFLQMDLSAWEAHDFLNEYYPDGVDIVFALSLYKHLGNRLWSLLHGFKWKRCYIESNNTGESRRNSDLVKEMDAGILNFDASVSFMGFTEDRSPRAIWLLERRKNG